MIDSIVYGDRIPEKGQVRITGILVDNFAHKIRFIGEYGLNVEGIDFTIERAQELGILNLEPLISIMDTAFKRGWHRW